MAFDGSARGTVPKPEETLIVRTGETTVSHRTAFLYLAAFYGLQKLAIPIGGKDRIQLMLVMMYGIAALFVVYGVARVDPRKILVLFALIAVAIVNIVVCQTIHASAFSPASFALFVVVYLPCVLTMSVSPSSYENILRAFVSLGLCAAALVAFNWFTQLVRIGLPINLDTILPEPTIFRQYVYIQPIAWRSIFMKPNAVFFLETSVLSQFLAATLVIELCFFRRLFVLGGIAVALAATFGGTGLLLLILVAPFVLPYLRTQLVIGGALASPLLLGLAYAIGLLDNIMHRSNDFSRQGSSADDRFVKQIEIMKELFAGDGFYLAFGHGPGSLNMDATSAYFLAVVKASYEYGLVFAALYVVFTVLICFGRGVPIVVGAVGFMTFHFLTASFLIPLFVYIPLFLSGAYRIDRAGAQPSHAP